MTTTYRIHTSAGTEIQGGIAYGTREAAQADIDGLLRSIPGLTIAEVVAKPKTRTITLTDRRPVTIDDDQWPEIAHGAYRWHDNQYRSQANRAKDLDIRVREHADGRALVYGVYSYSTAYQGERGASHRVGYLLEPGADLIAAIKRCAADLIQRGVDCVIVRDTADECIGELPALEI